MNDRLKRAFTRVARLRSAALVTALSLSSVACGREAGRVRFSSEGSAEASSPLKAGDVALWTDIDIEYEGDAALAYRVELVQGGAVVAATDCDPLGRVTVKTGWTETNLGGSHTRRGNGKMTCSASLAKAGPTTVKATLAFRQKPTTIVLRRADLVIKQ